MKVPMRLGWMRRLDLKLTFTSNKSVNALIQSDIYHIDGSTRILEIKYEGIRENYHQQWQDIMDPEAFFPVAKNPQTVRIAQLAVLELLKQPEGSDVSWLIKIFGGIRNHFKQSLSQSCRHVPASCFEKEE